MGVHPLDWVIILVLGLLILGPKTIQSISRNAGKTVGQAKEAKEKLLAELPVEELNQVRSSISRIPLSPQQAVSMLLTPEETRKQELEAQQVSQPQGGKNTDPANTQKVPQQAKPE